LSVRPPVFDRDVATLDMAGFSEALLDRFDKARVRSRRYAGEDSDCWHRWLLRARCERPRDGRAAEKRDELASLHSITSSARVSSVACFKRPAVQKPDHGDRRLLRARRERPRRRAAEQRDEVAAVNHSITSSAATSRPGGTVRPSTLAVWALMTS